MNGIVLMKIEWMKQKRRLNWVIPAAFLGFFAGFLSWSLKGEIDPWDYAFALLPVMNALLLPSMIAILASRITDVEHQGNTMKLLETFAPRLRILGIKFLYGGVLMAGFLGLQLLITRWASGVDCPLSAYLYRYYLDALVVSLSLLLLHMTLSLVFPNQAVTIILGIAGSLLGFFLLFMPVRWLYLTNPWSMFAAVGFVEVNYDPLLETTVYVYRETVPLSQLAMVIWFLVALAGSIYFCSRENEASAGTIVVQEVSTNGTAFSHIGVEFQKLRHAPVWLAFFLIPLISAVFGTINYLGNIEILQSNWYSLWSQHTLFLSMLFFPMLMAVFCSFQWGLEHRGTNWNQMAVLETPWQIMREKTFTSSVFIMLCVLWVGLLFVLSGLIAGIRSPLPVDFISWMVCGILGGITACCFQSLVSLVIRNFALPIGIAVMGTISIFYLGVEFRNLDYFVPYTLPVMGMRANNPWMELNVPLFVGSCVCWIILTLLLGVLYLKKTDIRTH